MSELINSFHRLSADHVARTRNDAGIVILLEEVFPRRIEQSHAHRDPYLGRYRKTEVLQLRETVREILGLGPKNDRVASGLAKVVARIGAIRRSPGEHLQDPPSVHPASRRCH